MFSNSQLTEFSFVSEHYVALISVIHLTLLSFDLLMSWLGHCPSAFSQPGETKHCAKHRLCEKHTISLELAPEEQRA